MSDMPTPHGPRVLVADPPAVDEARLWVPTHGEGLRRAIVMATGTADEVAEAFGRDVLEVGDIVWFAGDQARELTRRVDGRLETLWIVNMGAVMAYERDEQRTRVEAT